MRTYQLMSTRPDILQLRTARLELPPGAEAFIRLRVLPQTGAGSERVHILVNDERGQNEECLLVNVVVVAQR